MKSYKRLRACADPRIQLGFAARVAVYWLTCQFSMALVIFTVIILQGSNAVINSPWQIILPAVIFSSLLLPLALVDLMVITNRFVGPIFRIRGYLKQLIATGSVPELTLRTGDHYLDVAENINHLVKRLKQAESTAAPPSNVRRKELVEQNRS